MSVTYTVTTVCPAFLRETWTVHSDGPLSEGDAAALIQADDHCIEFEEHEAHEDAGRRIVVHIEKKATR